MISDTPLGAGLAFASMSMFSANILLTRMAMARLRLDVGFLIAVTVNVAFGALLFGIELALRTQPLAWNPTAFWLFMLSGVFTTYLGRWFFFETVARLGPARASVFQVSSPMFTALVAWLVLGERLSATVLMAMFVVMLGLYLTSAPSGSVGLQRSSAGDPPVPGRAFRMTAARRIRAGALMHAGVLLGVGSSLAYAVGNVLRGAATHRWREPVLGALLGAITGLALHLASSSATRQLLASLRIADSRGVLLYIVCGLLTISAQMLTIASMSFIPVSIAALITLCTPVLVLPLSHWLFGHEHPLTPTLIGGSGLALAGIAVIVLR